MIERLVIAGGKTGGHLYPGVAVAEEVHLRNAAAAVVFIGTRDGIEARVLPKLGLALELVRVSRLKGSGLLERLRSLLRLPGALLQSMRVLRRHRPQVVLGVGGYASGPALLAAWLLRIPTAIQEQNAVPGLTNRLLARLARHVYLGFDAAGPRFGGRRTVPTGNPIRRALVTALGSKTAREPAAGRLRVLVFGGSQGSRFLNERVPPALVRLATEHPDLDVSVTHQTGLAEEGPTRARYAGTPLEPKASVLPYIDDMPRAYEGADVAVCRAGALTIAELTSVSLPSLLVPFPHAADDHQTANAAVLADAGASVLVRETEWDEARVASLLADLARDPDRLRSMGERARALARPEAARVLVDHLEQIAA